MQRVADGNRWMLRLSEGDDLHVQLAAFAEAEAVRAGAVVMGIGLLATASVGYWNGREYATRDLSTPHELLSLGGSIAVADGRPSIHLHASLAGPDHAVVGGHLVRGKVGVLAEILVTAFPGRTFGRPLVESQGLRALDLEPGPSD
jgi:predicted DNA-binding protein with PD1-like motif